jgi:holliday junction DNA helicase RuvA
MIAKLRGLLDSVGEGTAVLDVGGVGYLVFVSGRTARRMGEPGHEVTLLVETHVREDHIHLYGFAERSEREMFRLLLTVQGVGAKVALAVLSVLSADELMTAIAAQDRVPLTRADGVGPKLAKRVVNELKDKAMPFALAAAPAPGKAAKGAKADAAAVPDIAADAVSALVNLGYGRTEAYGAVATAQRRIGAEARLEQLITAGLRELAS